LPPPLELELPPPSELVPSRVVLPELLELPVPSVLAEPLELVPSAEVLPVLPVLTTPAVVSAAVVSAAVAPGPLELLAVLDEELLLDEASLVTPG
jgi:hypothetical protein